MIGSVLANLGLGAVNNVMSEWHADQAFKRQKELMGMQQRMNNANAVNAFTQQVEGARMAGLNPAMLNGQQPAVQNVSQATAPKGENVELDPADMLLMAQKENLDADTKKKNAETGNVNEDTELKFAQKLFTGANQEKIEEETRGMRQINDQYAAENRAVKEFGKAMAERWQGTNWYNKLSQDTKDTIDSIAAGTTDMSIGGLKALRNVIDSQKELSDADRKLVSNAFDNAVTEAMFSEDAVMEALAKMPKASYDKLVKDKDKIIAETDRIKYKMQEFIDAEIAGRKLSNTDLQNRIKAFVSGDLDYLKSQGEYGKWFEKYAEDRLADIIRFGVPGMAINAANKSMQRAEQASEVNRRKKAVKDLWDAVQKDPRYNAMPKPDVQGNDSYWKF